MTESRQNNNVAVFFGGLMIGAIASALMSPKSGEDMRKDVKEKAQSVKDKIESKKNDVSEKATDKAEETLEKTQETLDKRQSKQRGSNL